VNQILIVENDIQSKSPLDEKTKKVEELDKILLYAVSQNKNQEIEIGKLQEENSQLVLQKEDISKKIFYLSIANGLSASVFFSLLVGSFVKK